jgi:hypothetical protein
MNMPRCDFVARLAGLLRRNIFHSHQGETATEKENRAIDPEGEWAAMRSRGPSTTRFPGDSYNRSPSRLGAETAALEFDPHLRR